MESIGDSFRAGGWGMWPTLIFGMVTLGLALRHAAAPDGANTRLLVNMGATTLLFGALGFVTGLIATTGAIPRVPIEERLTIALLGAGESLHNLALALVLVAMASVAGGVAMLRSPRGE